MKLKLEFLLPNMNAANKACDILLLARVNEKDIHFLAKLGTDMGKLKTASALEKTNIIHEGQRGVLIGAGVGLLVGLFVLIFPSWITYSPLWYTNSHWYVVLAVTMLAGAISVAVGAALLGVNVFNADLKHYKNRIDKGEVLMMVTVPFYSARKIRKLIDNPYQHKSSITL